MASAGILFELVSRCRSQAKTQLRNPFQNCHPERSEAEPRDLLFKPAEAGDTPAGCFQKVRRSISSICMNAQNSLFADTTELQPRGFHYRDDILTGSEEAALVESVGKLELKPFEFHGYLGNRRVVSFGLKYDYTRREVERASARPSFLDELLLRVADFAGCEPTAFQQIGVNEYRPGAGIGWHKDKPQFGIVVGVSLLATATLRFRRKVGARWERISHNVRPRSIYILSGEARTQWEHSIPVLDQLRYSITFRTLAEGFQLEKADAHDSDG